MLPQRTTPPPIVPPRTSPRARRIYKIPGDLSKPKSPQASAFELAQQELLKQGRADYHELSKLRSGGFVSSFAQRPATVSGRPSSTRGPMLRPVSPTIDRIDLLSAASYSRPPSSRPMTQASQRRRDHGLQQAGDPFAAERQVWRNELSAMEEALAESEARCRALEAAHAPAHAAAAPAASSVPRAISVSRAGPARLSPAVLQRRAKQEIAKGRLEHDMMRVEVEADLQLMWRGLKADMVSLAAAVKSVDRRARRDVEQASPPTRPPTRGNQAPSPTAASELSGWTEEPLLA